MPFFRPRSNRLFRDVLLSFGVLIGFCCTLELALRAAGQHYQDSIYVPDPEFGHKLRPNAVGWNVSENQNLVRVNSAGMHDREHSFHRGPDVIRIAVVGDSNTEAAQVPIDQNYCSVMERELNARLSGSGTTVEVLNFAVGGYGPAQEYLVIEKDIWRFDPQIVILANATEISILRSTRALYLGGEDQVNPFFVLQNGEVAEDPQTQRERAAFRPRSGLSQRVNNLTNQIRLLALLRAGRQEWEKRAAQFRAGFKAGSKSAEDRKGSAGSDTPFAHLGPYAAVPRVQRALAHPDVAAWDPEVGRAWQTTQAIVVRARDTAAAHHAQLWLFTLDIAVQVDPDQAVRAEFQKELGVSDLFAVDRRLSEFANREGIPIGVLGPEICAYAEQHRTVLHGFPGTERNSGHWNALGHSVVGRLMAQRLWEECPLLHTNGLTQSQLLEKRASALRLASSSR